MSAFMMISTVREGAEMNTLFFVMAGGAGTRFWPLSTKNMPKQFLCLFDGKSLLEMTLNRISRHFDRNDIYILTRESYINHITNNYSIPPEHILGEKYPRDTSASVAIAVYYSLKIAQDPVCVILPSDHIIETPLDFYNDLARIFEDLNCRDGIFTLGIKPSYPATGYGYLELEGQSGQNQLCRVVSFREKPDLSKASAYIESGNFLWNSGIFIFRAQTMAKYIEEFLPTHLKIRDAFESSDYYSKLGEVLYSLPRISIDYAVMEKLQNIYTLPASFAWNDMGGWLSLAGYLQGDKNGNYFNNSIHLLDAKNNIAYSEDRDEDIVLVGVNDLVVVRADRKTLVIHKDHMEDMKKITELFN